MDASYHYTDDILHDLHYHHEFYHLITTYYDSTMTWAQWHKKMDTIEFWASLESEVLIYFYMPGLRDLSFKNELWVDSYLERPDLQALKDCYGQYTSTQSEAIRLFLASERKRCETEPYNDIEKMVGQYTVSSYQWAKIWKNSWQEVETHVQLFLNNPDKKEALKKHLQWLKEKQAQSQTGVVFEEEAQAYSDVHQSMFKSSYNPVN